VLEWADLAFMNVPPADTSASLHRDRPAWVRWPTVALVAVSITRYVGLTHVASLEYDASYFIYLPQFT